jgi:hypothetical protein
MSRPECARAEGGAADGAADGERDQAAHNGAVSESLVLSVFVKTASSNQSSAMPQCLCNEGDARAAGEVGVAYWSADDNAIYCGQYASLEVRGCAMAFQSTHAAAQGVEWVKRLRPQTMQATPRAQALGKT